MGSIKTSTGLASGIDTSTLIQALLTANQSAIAKIQNRQKTIQASQAGLSTIQAGLLSITTSAQTLSTKSTFQSLTVQNSDPAQLSVTTNSTATASVQQFQTVRLATTDQSLSRGFADANQKLGLTGEIVVNQVGHLSRPTSLDLLNNGAGVRRGSIRITDRAGETATVDLTKALTVDDVVQAINGQSSAAVKASAQGDKIVLRDTSGQTTNNLTIIDLNNGHAAEDLGIEQSVAGSTLTGSTIYQISSDVSLNSLNDGNGMRLRSGSAAELSITLKDGTNLQVDLDSARTIGDVVQAITSNSANGGKLSAALVDGRLQLTDTTGGTGTLSVDALPNTNAADVLGLNLTADDAVLTGKRLGGGMNSVLLRNLRGGRGITTPGEISLTDRTGATAIVDLSTAESLDEVLTAIDNATTSGNVKLQLQAGLDASGTGIVISDTSGQTASNLIVADVNGGTLAGDLNIDIDAAASSVSSGSLRLRAVNDATSLSKYAPSGGAVSSGSFSITNSAGASAVINIGSTTKTLGDVIDRINSSGINVTAELNETGDGFVLTDNAAGTNTLKVLEIGGSAARDLRLLGEPVTGTDGKQRIVSRDAAIVKIVADDTLTTISTKLNTAGGTVRASVIDSGSAINPFRLSLSATASGADNRLVIDDGGLGFNFSKQVAGQDAVLRIGSDPASAFLKTSSTNTFANAVTGYNVTLLKPSDQPATVIGSLDTNAIGNALSTMVRNYNQLVGQIDTLTKYDPATQARAALQGSGTVLQIESRITGLVNRVTGSPTSSVRSLADVGVVVGAGGNLSFDQFKFEAAMADHPEEVIKLFTDSTSGFGVRLNAALKDLNDPDKGSLTAEVEANDAHIKALDDQIERMNASMTSRQTYLELQFANMEKVLSSLQSQQDALTALANIAEASKSSSKN